MHLLDMIGFWGRERPHHPAIIQSDTVVTFKGLADAIKAASARIARYDLQPGEAVASLLRSPINQLVVTMALLRRGLAAAPIQRGLLPVIRGAGIEHLISDSEQQVLSKGLNIRFDASWMRAGELSASPAQPKPAAYGNLIFFSSGSTGMPKKIVYTNDALIERMRLAPVPSYVTGSRMLVSLGIATAGGFNPVCELLHAGRTVCLPVGTESPWPMIRDFGIDGILASTQQALSLVKEIEAREWISPIEPLKFIRLSGGLHSDQLVRRLKANLGNNVWLQYGSTEAGTVAAAPYDAIADVPHSVGFVWPWADVKIVDGSGAALPLGEEGHIRCRTPVYVKSFAANNPDSQQDANTAWWDTGDRGWLTADRVLCVVGRSVDVINRGGEKISAVLLDELLQSVSGVKDAGVCGVAGPSGVIEIWAGVVCDPATDFERIKRRVEDQVGRTASFDAIVAIGSVPRTDVGKIKRPELRDMLLALRKQSTLQ